MGTAEEELRDLIAKYWKYSSGFSNQINQSINNKQEKESGIRLLFTHEKPKYLSIIRRFSATYSNPPGGR